MKKLILLLFVCQPIQAQLSANQIIEKIKSELTCDWPAQTVDNIKAGNPETIVTGVASTFMATLDVLKKAKAAGCNFVISHEPTFYSHTDNLSIHEKDPIQVEKLKFIKDNNMVVWRFHDQIHRTHPDQIFEGVIGRLGWQQYRIGNTYNFNIPEASLKAIVGDIEKKFKTKTMRVVGNPKSKFTKVGLVLGASGSAAHFRMLQNPDCELLIVGESNEWETVPYVQDAISIGQNKALIVMGHADSEEEGMVYFAKWLSGFYPNLNIKFIEAGNPYWRR